MTTSVLDFCVGKCFNVFHGVKPKLFSRETFSASENSHLRREINFANNRCTIQEKISCGDFSKYISSQEVEPRRPLLPVSAREQRDSLRGFLRPRFAMARLNIEADAWLRIKTLAAHAKCPEPLALGAVAFIWKSSQDLEISEASREDLFVWSGVKDPNVFEDLLAAMHKPTIRFLKLKGDGVYEIVGNKKQIIALKKYKKRASDAAKNRWRKPARKIIEKPHTPLVPTDAEECSKHATSNASPNAQYKAKQGKTKQSNSKQDKAIPIRGEEDLAPHLKKIWSAYSEGQKRNYGVHPLFSVQEVRLLEALDSALGPQASDVVTFYCTVGTKFYISQRHALKYCVDDMAKLHLAYMQELQQKGLG